MAGSITSPGYEVLLTASYPSSATAWTVNALENDNHNSSWSVTAYAICG